MPYSARDLSPLFIQYTIDRYGLGASSGHIIRKIFHFFCLTTRHSDVINIAKILHPEAPKKIYAVNYPNIAKNSKNENVLKTCLKRVKTVLVACLKQIKRSIVWQELLNIMLLDDT